MRSGTNTSKLSLQQSFQLLQSQSLEFPTQIGLRSWLQSNTFELLIAVALFLNVPWSHVQSAHGTLSYLFSFVFYFKAYNFVIIIYGLWLPAREFQKTHFTVTSETVLRCKAEDTCSKQVLYLRLFE